MISYDKLREWLCNWVYGDCIPPSVIVKEGMEGFRMTEKRFTMTYGKYKDNFSNKEYDEKLESWKICDLLNDLSDENEELKKALFFYLDIVLSESLTDFDKWCNLLFNCNYEEAKRKYGDFKYKERWESE